MTDWFQKHQEEIKKDFKRLFVRLGRILPPGETFSATLRLNPAIFPALFLRLDILEDDSARFITALDTYLEKCPVWKRYLPEKDREAWKDIATKWRFLCALPSLSPEANIQLPSPDEDFWTTPKALAAVVKKQAFWELLRFYWILPYILDRKLGQAAGANWKVMEEKLEKTEACYQEQIQNYVRAFLKTGQVAALYGPVDPLFEKTSKIKNTFCP